MKRALLALVVLIVGCAAPDGRTGSGRPRVVAGFAPLAEVVRRIGGDDVVVTNLTPAGAEPHDVELTTNQLDAVLDADLVVYAGRGFQPAIEDAARDAEGRTLDVLEELDLLDGSEGADPHVWLDPSLMEAIAAKVADEMRALGRGLSAESVAGRARSFRTALRQLDERYRMSLAECERDVIVTSHAAFGYLARAYGLTQVAVAGLEPEAEPDPRRFARVADVIRKHGVTTVFIESEAASEVADALTRETGARTAVLSTIENIPDGENYVSLMERNLRELTRALGCT